MRKRRNTSANHSRPIEYESDDIRELYRLFVRIKLSEGIAENTVKQYDTNFGQFLRYVEYRGGNYSAKAITTEFIRDWITYMLNDQVQFERITHRTEKAVGLAPATVNTRLKTIRVMFGTLHKNLVIPNNPMASVKNVREPEELIDVLTDAEIRRLLSAMDRTYYTSFRDYVLTVLLLDAMLRITEATTLKRSDVDFEGGFVAIRGNIAKSRIARLVPVTSRTMTLIRELIRENEYSTDSEYVFATEKGTPYDRNRYNQRLKDYANRAFIDKAVHPHLLRHTAATRWLENGGSLEELRRILGHSKYEMVKRYAHVNNKTLKASANAHSLVNRLSDM